MQTVTNAETNTAIETDASATPKLTAREARDANLAFNGDKPLVELTGNGYPIRALLWVLGGTYDKANKRNLIPEHNRQKAQDAIDGITAKIQARITKKAEAKVAEPEAKPQDKAPAKAKAPKALRLTRNQPSRKSTTQIVAERRAKLIEAQAARDAAKAGK